MYYVYICVNDLCFRVYMCEWIVLVFVYVLVSIYALLNGCE